MREDIAGSLTAIVLFPLILLLPGYAIARLADVFEFRRRTAVFRLALAVPLSIAVCPIVTFLLGRFCPQAVWIFYPLAACVFLADVWRQPRRFRLAGDWRIIAAALGVWLVVVLGSLIDIQLGDRLYYPTSALDNSVRAAFTHAISSAGIPPQSPLFFPGRPVLLRYHYFWFMMCSLVEQAGHGMVSARQALIGGTFWCGVGLMALLAIFLRLVLPGDPARLRRRIGAAFLLLGVTGLDIVPTALLLLLHARGALPFVLPSVEWWNEHVDWFVYTTLWAPHALAALIACFTAFLLLWKAPHAAGRRGIALYSSLAGVALASAVGASIYVAFAFAVFLIAWTALTALRKWYRETLALLAAGTTCILAALPYLLGLRVPAAGTFDSGEPLQFTVRAFSFAALVPGWHGMSQMWRLLLVNLPLVPLNYALEFGFFFFAGVLEWRKLRRGGRPLTRAQLAAAAMIVTSALICTFLRSNVIGCNDLGWRGFLVAQFVLLLCGADLLAGWPRLDFVSPGERRVLAVFLILGTAGTVYDLALTRVYPILADRGVVPPLDWMSPDRQFGKRTYAARAAYEWARTATAGAAAIQFNPKVAFQETTAFLYADRRTVAADRTCNTSFGGDEKRCAPIVARLNQLYAAALPDTGSVCENLPVDLVIAKDTDPAWRDPQSWVWREEPVFRSDYIRLFACRKEHAASP